MSVTIERGENECVIRLEGVVNIGSADELKQLLLDGLASPGALHLDLERVDEMDIAVMQLLWAAGQSAERTGATIVARVSEAASSAARDAGFQKFPGENSKA